MALNATLVTQSLGYVLAYCYIYGRATEIGMMHNRVRNLKLEIVQNKSLQIDFHLNYDSFLAQPRKTGSIPTTGMQIIETIHIYVTAF